MSISLSVVSRTGWFDVGKVVIESGSSLVSSCESVCDLTSCCSLTDSSILLLAFAALLTRGVDACEFPCELWVLCYALSLCCSDDLGPVMGVDEEPVPSCPCGLGGCVKYAVGFLGLCSALFSAVLFLRVQLYYPVGCRSSGTTLPSSMRSRPSFFT